MGRLVSAQRGMGMMGMNGMGANRGMLSAVRNWLALPLKKNISAAHTSDSRYLSVKNTSNKSE